MEEKDSGSYEVSDSDKLFFFMAMHFDELVEHATKVLDKVKKDKQAKEDNQ